MRIKKTNNGGAIVPQNDGGVAEATPPAYPEILDRQPLKIVRSGVLSWYDVGEAIRIYLHKLLGRKILCEACPSEIDYWCVVFCGTRISAEELEILFRSVSADEETREDTRYSDDALQSYGSIGCLLSDLLLQQALSMSWKKTFAMKANLIMFDSNIRRQNNG